MSKAFECDQCSHLYTEQINNPTIEWDGEEKLPDLCPWCIVDAIQVKIEELRCKQDEIKEEYGEKP